MAPSAESGGHRRVNRSKIWARCLRGVGAAFVVCLFALGSVHTAHAEGTAVPSLTQAQAQQLLGVLNDDAKRKAFATTLKNLATAQTAGVVPGVPKAKPQSDSLGDQMLSSVVDFGRSLQHEAHVLIGTIGNVRALGVWVVGVVQAPSEQAVILKVLLRVAVLLAVGGVLFAALRLALKKPRAALEARGQQRNADEERAERREVRQVAEMPIEQSGTTRSAEDVERNEAQRVRHQGSWSKLVLAFRRLPFAFGLFVLDVLPIAMFPLAAFLIEGLDDAGDGATGAAIEAVAWIGCFGACGLVAFVQMLFAPQQAWRRLLIMGNKGASFWFGWLKRLGTTLGFGLAILTVLSSFGMPDAVVGALGKLLALIIHLQLLFMILRGRAPVWKLCEQVAERSRVPGLLRFIGHGWWIAAIFFDLALWLVWAAEIHGGYAVITTLFVRTCIAVALTRVVSIVAYGGVERLFRHLPDWASLTEDAQVRVSRYYPAVQHVVTLLLAVVTVFALSVAWGAPVRELFEQGGLGQHIFSSVLTILVALLIGVLVWEAVSIATERHLQRLAKSKDGVAKAARFRTLQPMLRIILLVVLSAVIGLTILSEIGVNTAPLLASASIFGVALGFGSQKLVQDFISGIFLLMENALTVGDAVTLSGTYGVVEKLSLRTVHVRANDGSMNIFPFSSLNQIINYNRDFARAIIVAEVGYSVDTDDVVKAIHDITAEMRADPDFKNLIIDDFQMWGVDSLNDWSVTVRGTLPTTTAGRWPVQRQFYRRMKKCFEARGIDIPFPTRTLEVSGLERLTDYRGPQGEKLGITPEHSGTVQAQDAEIDEKP
ncbi:mechanosensitive ion channel domain-containing protein [Neokomagataea anthophila]|uniref:Mechanosensitive ion channel n=1 Tax=Neokomagataea anthophila TaxID=2826925 RepID=A0ABS5E3S2_9PROT|nr:mechanosensitive ion channel domain-containing protein [Neokomagataea anthophila]MBR0558516.1 mechanosensitive ion channel [Neokomagataea anthophila]